ncbi:hypothetical protein POVCU2_0025960 [Plasmodium ovale curtisi]|uniref:Uncharacterized protein n=1 Tax=Plasmodium ovale curtisi TaxID=864141 RepID=A0A1A8VV90_PLAOA|nr:hypothetical protein POVCU2_0025960 [Plasmodium ovale curtisi]
MHVSNACQFSEHTPTGDLCMYKGVRSGGRKNEKGESIEKHRNKLRNNCNAATPQRRQKKKKTLEARTKKKLSLVQSIYTEL